MLGCPEQMTGLHMHTRIQKLQTAGSAMSSNGAMESWMHTVHIAFQQFKVFKLVHRIEQQKLTSDVEMEYCGSFVATYSFYTREHGPAPGICPWMLYRHCCSMHVALCMGTSSAAARVPYVVPGSVPYVVPASGSVATVGIYCNVPCGSSGLRCQWLSV